MHAPYSRGLLYPKWPLHVLQVRVAGCTHPQSQGGHSKPARWRKLGLAPVDSCQAIAYWDVTSKDGDALPAGIRHSQPMDSDSLSDSNSGIWETTFNIHSLPLLGQVGFLHC